MLLKINNKNRFRVFKNYRKQRIYPATEDSEAVLVLSDQTSCLPECRVSFEARTHLRTAFST
jgi:hypothetical protein